METRYSEVWRITHLSQVTHWFEVHNFRIHSHNTVNVTRGGFVLLAKFDWVVRYVISFQYVQFWIRLAAVSYRGKIVRTAVNHAVRSVNKSHDTRNWVQNEPEYAIWVLFAIHVYYKALGIIVCALIWQIRQNYNRLVTARCQRWARPVPWWQPIKFP